MGLRKLIVILLTFVFVLNTPINAMAMNMDTEEVVIQYNSKGCEYLIIPDEVYYQDNYTGYRYLVRPGTRKWAELKNHQEMVDACQISEEKLSSMSIKELVQSVLSYPLISDMFAYDSISDGINIVSQHYNGLKRLMSLQDNTVALRELLSLQKVNTYTSSDEEVMTRSLTNGKITTYAGQKASRKLLYSMVISTLIRAIDPYSVSLNRDNYYLYLLDDYAVEMYGYSTINTPRGTSINVFINRLAQLWMTASGDIEPRCQEGYYFNDFPASWISTRNNQNYLVYGIYPFSSPSVKYNCHFYAWNGIGGSLYWLDNPVPYLDDGSYIPISSASVSATDKVIYTQNGLGRIEHSAIVDSISGGNIIVRSKWGTEGTYLHNLSNCPFYYSTSTAVTYYR